MEDLYFVLSFVLSLLDTVNEVIFLAVIGRWKHAIFTHRQSATAHRSGSNFACYRWTIYVRVHAKFYRDQFAVCTVTQPRITTNLAIFNFSGKGKGKRSIAVRKKPHRYGNSRAIWDHPVLPATRQSWYSRLHPSRSWYSIKRPGGMQGWVDLVGWLQPEMVYPPEDGHPSQL